MSPRTLFSLSSPPFVPPTLAPLISEITTLTLQALPTTHSYYASVTSPIRRILAATPSSVAPTLCITACELVAGTKSQAMHAAAALQLMQAAAYARAGHMREGGPTSGVELMAGDAILPLGFELVGSAAMGEGEEERVVRAMKEMGKLMGTQDRGVVEGQWLEVEGPRTATARKELEWWLWERREGRMAACGAAVGAILGGGSEERVERLRRFGMHVGMMMMMMKADGEEGGKRREEVVEVFKSLARLELQGFDVGRVDQVLAILGLGSSTQN